MTKVRGRTLRQLREDAGLSRPQLAERLRASASGMDERSAPAVRQYLLRLEQSESADLDEETAEALAEALGVSVDDLAGELVWVLAGPNGLVDTGGFLIAFSDAVDARSFRDVLRHKRVPEAPHMIIYPVGLGYLLTSVLAAQLPPDVNPEELLLIDPDERRMQAAIVLEDVLRGATQPDEALAEALEADLALTRIAYLQGRRIEALEGLKGPDAAETRAARVRYRVLHELTRTVFDARERRFLGETEEAGS